jgi:hypothetical protein
MIVLSFWQAGRALTSARKEASAGHVMTCHRPRSDPLIACFAAYATFVVDIRAGIFGRKARLYETTAAHTGGLD